MAIPVKRIKRNKNMGDKNSPELYYLALEPGASDILTEEDLANDIELIGAMSVDDVTHVLRTFIRRMRLVLTQGNKVKINGLGTFHITFSNKGVEEEKDCTVRNIDKVNLRFKVDKNLRLVNESTAVTRSNNCVRFYIKGDSASSSSGDGGNNSGGDDGGWVDPSA